MYIHYFTTWIGIGLATLGKWMYIIRVNRSRASEVMVAEERSALREEMKVKRLSLYELRAARVRSLVVRDSGGAPITAINKSADAATVLRSIIGDRDREVLACLYLDTQNAITGAEVLALGGLNICSAMPRDIFRGAILNGALGIILAHNHPSGNPMPSPEDIEFTRSVAKAGRLLGVEVYDHIILGAGAHTSLREQGVM